MPVFQAATPIATQEHSLSSTDGGGEGVLDGGSGSSGGIDAVQQQTSGGDGGLAGETVAVIVMAVVAVVGGLVACIIIRRNRDRRNGNVGIGLGAGSAGHAYPTHNAVYTLPPGGTTRSSPYYLEPQSTQPYLYDRTKIEQSIGNDGDGYVIDGYDSKAAHSDGKSNAMVTATIGNTIYAIPMDISSDNDTHLDVDGYVVDTFSNDAGEDCNGDSSNHGAVPAAMPQRSVAYAMPFDGSNSVL